MRVIITLAVSFALLSMGCAHSPPPAVQDAAAGEVPREGYLPGAAGARIFYRVLGNGPDTIVAVHGGPGAGMNAILSELEPLAENHTVIFYDQRGGGRSELPQDTSLLAMRYFVDDLEALRRFFGLERMSIIAHSFGPVLVAHYAREHPERIERMVFFGASAPERAMGETMARARSIPQDSALLERQRRLVPKFERIDTVADPVAFCRDLEAIIRESAVRRGEPTRWTGTTCAMPPEAVRYYFRYTARLPSGPFGDWDFTRSLRHVQAPLLVIYGALAQEDLEAQRAWAAAVPDGRLLLIPGAGKGSSADRPDIFFPAVESFLAGRWPAGAEPVGPDDPAG
ncbi:MAG TPA: alpha/beta fold hydrolase [Longimicrobiaceae bacterium]|nr:alpha/beta fold hydrolase [Longimicrobiaceae bacterium]